MTAPRLHCRSLITSSVLLAASVPTLAQPPATEVFYVANYASSSILSVDFDSNTTTQINTDASELKNLGSLLVRNDGGGRVSIVVCDTGAGKVLLYENVTGPAGKGKVITSAVPMPDGISADESGNLFLITSGPGSGGNKKRQLWTIPRDPADAQDGYGDAVLIDGNIAADLLEDTRVVRVTFGSLALRDVLVLWRKPAKITRYRPDGAGGYTVATFTSSFPSGAELTGMAFGGGYLLVSTLGGDVLRVRPDGTKDPTNFVSGLGNGLSKIAVGFQNDQDVAGVVQRNGHNAYLIDINPDGTGTVIDGESQNLDSPQGVGIGNGNGVFIPAVASVTAAFPAQDTTFTGTSQAGGADLACRLLPLPDPRELSDCNVGNCLGICQPDDFCERDLLLSELDPSLPYGGSVTIPGHVRALRIGDPVTGTPRVFFCEGQTSASFRFASTLVHEDEFLNWPDQDPGPGVRREPDCQDPVTSDRAMFYWTPIPVSEPRIFEGTLTSSRFINLSTGCVQSSSNRGDVDDYSIFLPAAREMDPLCKVVDDGLAGLLGALGMPELADFIPGTPSGGVEKQLLDKLAAAVEAFRRYKRGNRRSQGVAMQRLDEFIAIVEGAAIDNTAAGRNVSGELIVRARSARYIISQVTPALLDACP